MMEGFIVMDTDVYTVPEAVNMFQRHVICAKTGLYQFYGDSHMNLGLSCGPLKPDHNTVFDVFAEQANRAERLLRQDELERDLLINKKKQLEAQREINNHELQLKRDK